jgi:hypothetical protein
MCKGVSLGHPGHEPTFVGERPNGQIRMIMGTRPEVGPMAVFASILQTMSIALSNAA